MTQITGKEPAHWHKEDSNGVIRHNMTDPRTSGVPLTRLSRDEQDYVHHLKAHEDELTSLEPLETDPQVIGTVLAYIASEQRRIASLREVVTIVRQEIAAGVPPKDSQGIALLKKIWPPQPSEQSRTDAPAGFPDGRTRAMITGTVSGPDEAFAVGEAVRAVLADDQVRRTTSADQFQERVRAVVTGHQPAASEGFVQYVTEVAWAERVNVSPAAPGNHSTRQAGTEHAGRDVPAAGEEETR